MNDDFYEVEEEDFDEDAYAVEIQQILANYQQKKLVENLIGPSVSFVFHVVLVIALAFIWSGERIVTEPPVEVDTVIQEPVEIEEEIIEEIEEIVEEEPEEEMPEVEVTETPDTQTEEVVEDVSDVIDDMPTTDDNMEMDMPSDVVLTDSPMVLTSLFGGRSASGRATMVKKGGGSAAGQKSVKKSLNWLARVQNADGSWGDGNRTAAYSGLALLCFLAHGETPTSAQYGDTVRKAIMWMSKKGNSSSGFGKNPYINGIATYAISEAYAMTEIPMIKPVMEKNIQRIIDGQQANGGFDYNYSKGERWDVSVVGWQVQALKAAYIAGATNSGIKEALDRTERFFKTTAYDAKGKGYGYTSAKAGNKLSGVGVVSLQLMGQKKSNQVQDTLASVIAQKCLANYKKVGANQKAFFDGMGKFIYGFYYDTQAVFNNQDSGRGRKLWKEWRRTFEPALIKHQDPEGYWDFTQGHSIGSHKDNGVSHNGRVMGTCFATLQLEVYYRYLPTFDINKINKNVNQGADAVGDEVDDLLDL
ncbi:MAG: hypothetical protein MK193_13100 [Lentisphaeria bacterium]|nr:hypothetical protein [Lentisphaeria bacterium]